MDMLKQLLIIPDIAEDCNQCLSVCKGFRIDNRYSLDLISTVLQRELMFDVYPMSTPAFHLELSAVFKLNGVAL